MTTIERLIAKKTQIRPANLDPTPWDAGAGDPPPGSVEPERQAEEVALTSRIVAAAAWAREESLRGVLTGYDLSPHELQVLDRILRRGSK